MAFCYGDLLLNIDVKKPLKYKKRVIRNISNVEYNVHTSVLYKKLNIPKVDDLFKIQICKFMYLLINCMLPESLMNIFTPSSGVHNYNTRQKYFSHVNTRTNMVSKTFIHQGPKLWQELPFDIQNSKSLIIFNKRIKKYFMNIY